MKCKSTPTCDVPPREPQIETGRLAESVEGLNSSLALTAGELWIGMELKSSVK